MKGGQASAREGIRKAPGPGHLQARPSQMPAPYTRPRVASTPLETLLVSEKCHLIAALQAPLKIPR